ERTARTALRFGNDIQWSWRSWGARWNLNTPALRGGRAWRPATVVSWAPRERAIWVGLLRVRYRPAFLPWTKERRKAEVLIDEVDRLARVAANLVSETEHFLLTLFGIRVVRTAPALLRHQG